MSASSNHHDVDIGADFRARLESLKDWIGQREVLTDYVTIASVQRLSATLDRDDPLPCNGDPLPLGWHSILFPRVVRHSEVGADGHPQRGDFLPPVPLPRRMFAGRRSWFHQALRVGDVVTKDARIHAITIKEGRAGTMVFVTVRAEISTTAGVAITEEQDIVYRGEPSVGAGSMDKPAPRRAPNDAPWRAVVQADEVRLFRYSALTFNGHRIHYDQPYATQNEGYPGLVMNGGLTTLFLYELIRAHSDRALKMLSSRNVTALFANQPVQLLGVPSTDGLAAQLFAVSADGAIAVEAQAAFD